MVQLRYSTNQTSIRVGQPVQSQAPSHHPAPMHPNPSSAPVNQHVNIRINSRPVNTLSPTTVNHAATSLPGVSIIVCTNRPSFIDRVMANYSRQTYPIKELIVILNNNSMSPEEWWSKSPGGFDIRIFQQDESKSLGECLNFGVEQCSYDYIAKFDDDDYYGPNYLIHQMQAMIAADADLTGKATWYLYFERSNTLAVFIRHPENSYVNYVTGATLLVKKEVFNSIRFSSLNAGEDVDFVAVCKEHGLRIYSTDKADFVGIRRAVTSSHTWQEPDEQILTQCRVVAITDNYVSWVDS